MKKCIKITKRLKQKLHSNEVRNKLFGVAFYITFFLSVDQSFASSGHPIYRVNFTEVRMYNTKN